MHHFMQESKKKGRSNSSFIFLFCLGLLWVAGCRSAAEPDPAASDLPPGLEINEIGPEDKAPPVIKIVANNWGGSEVNAAIAAELIHTELGYETEIVRLDENAQWAEIASGDAHISLEVWPSGHQENMQEFIEKQQTVDFAGFLGPVGKVSWYVPAYMLERYPELDDWESLKRDEISLLFATAETNGRGQLLGPRETDTTFDEAIIENLELPFEVVYAGSERAIMAGVEAAIAREDPILFYFWTPHALHAEYDLVPIELPEFYLGCWDNPAGVDCDYPEETLFKIVWYRLQEEAPDVYSFVRRMQLTLEDQVGMLGEIKMDEVDAATAAEHWIKENRAVWESWLQ